MDDTTKLERGPMVGRMLEGDFEKDTITFHMPATYYLASGRYIIEPESDWVRRKEQLTALSAHASAGEGGEWAKGVKACIAWVEKRRHDFESEYGMVDPSTGAMEFRSVAKEEYDCELGEIEEGMRSLLTAAPQPAAPQPHPELPSAQGWLDSHCAVAATEWMHGWDAARAALAAAASQPQGAPAQATVKESLTVHPAHGDGEGDDPFGDMPAPIGNPEAWPPNYADGYNDAVHNMVDSFPSVRARLTARLNPEAQEARDGRPTMRELIDVLPDGGSVSLLEQLQRMAQDAARYRWLADGLSELADNPRDVLINAVWMESPSEMDAAIDAALALPAQGEGRDE